MAESNTTTGVAGSRAHPKLEVQEGAIPALIALCLHNVLYVLLYSEALWHACLVLHKWNRAQANMYKANGLGDYYAANWSFVVSRQTRASPTALFPPHA
jgi:hypothetical protein